MNIHPDLLASATEVMKKAYSPYSTFKVGAAVLSNNKIYSGCNVENSSFRLTVCAEASAICQMIADNSQTIDQILIINNNIYVKTRIIR